MPHELFQAPTHIFRGRRLPWEKKRLLILDPHGESNRARRFPIKVRNILYWYQYMRVSRITMDRHTIVSDFFLQPFWRNKSVSFIRYLEYRSKDTLLSLRQPRWVGPRRWREITLCMSLHRLFAALMCAIIVYAVCWYAHQSTATSLEHGRYTSTTHIHVNVYDMNLPCGKYTFTTQIHVNVYDTHLPCQLTVSIWSFHPSLEFSSGDCYRPFTSGSACLMLSSHDHVRILEEISEWPTISHAN